MIAVSERRNYISGFYSRLRVRNWTDAAWNRYIYEIELEAILDDAIDVTWLLFGLSVGDQHGEHHSALDHL